MLTPTPPGPPPPEGRPRLPVARPALPRTETLVPYLRQIDESRIYSNHGPLVAQLEARMAARLGLGGTGVISCSTGTMALVAAIRAARGLSRARAPVPVARLYVRRDGGGGAVLRL